MPFIGCQMNKQITKEQAYKLKRRFGKSIELFPRIKEDVLMVSIQDECDMAFKGNANIPMAFVDVRIFAGALEENPNFGVVSKYMIEAISDEVEIPEDNIYITFASVANWGRKNDSKYML